MKKHKDTLLRKDGQVSPKSETETVRIVGRFHRFEEWAPTSVQRVNVCTFLYSTYTEKTYIWGKNGQKET